MLAAELGDGWDDIEEGLSARTTAVDDPLDPRLNGRAYLPAALASHLPLDLVIVLLGSNDTKRYFRRSPFDVITGAAGLLGEIAASAGGVGTAYPAPKAMLVAPPLPAASMPDPWLSMMFEGARETLAEVRDGYRGLAESMKAGFFDAGSVIDEVGVDGLHLTEENNRALGRALAPVVRDLLA